MNHDQWRRLCWLALSLQATEPSLMPFEFRPRTSMAENLLNSPLCKIFVFFSSYRFLPVHLSRLFVYLDLGLP